MWEVMELLGIVCFIIGIILLIVMLVIKQSPIIPVIVICSSVLIWFIGWGNQPVVDPDEPVTANNVKEDEEEALTEEDSEVTQEELDEQLKDEAVEADFVELNSGEAESDQRVFIEGKVLDEPEEKLQEFMVSTYEGDGYGIYIVKDFDPGAEFKEGDIIRAYGIYNGKHEELGGPLITATLIENVDFDENNEAHVKLVEDEEAPTE
ncbi:hypothetical protein [Gracilibacillus lacisalsi]|uniref:hypothetical protein n=1 Tax=Gracilibacillus lacisalsi TaxID=393087 RepID=UPI00036F88E4|nr:hypothetical protein [Gracilibacillus lacisalsi]